MSGTPVNSPNNSIFQMQQKVLENKNFRRREGLIWVEGSKVIMERPAESFKALILGPKAGKRQDWPVPPYCLSEELCKKVFVTENSQEVGALLHWNSLLVIGSIFVTLVGLTTFTSRLEGVHISIVIGLLVLSIILLITSADFFIEGAKGLAEKAGIAEVIIGLTIVSIGTSLPEILVTSTAAASAGRTGDTAMMDLAIGNIFGSVLVQITFILGIVALVTPLNIRPDWLRRDGSIMLGAVILC